MKSSLVLSAAMLLALVAGCRGQRSAMNNPEGAHNLWVNEWYQEQSQDAAVIRQAAVFPGQFVTGTARLTGTGARDLDILITHYGEYGGAISVRRGGVSDELYAARVTAVSNAFLEAGVPEGFVTFGDQQPGGAGLPSHAAGKALAQPPFETTSSTSSSTLSSEGGGR